MKSRIGRVSAVATLVALSMVGAAPAGPAGAAIPLTITRIAGATRDLTSVAASQNLFPTSGSAKAVVLASDATFADALAGAPLAVAKDGPMLLTTPTGLDPAVGTEITRVLPAGGTVYVLGGVAALSGSIDTQLSGMGFSPQRLAGADRFGTAVAVAGALGNPTTVLEASGLDFPDGLSAGAAAGVLGGVVLLTNGSTQASETAAYLAAHPGGKHYAVGGPAAAADPAATPIAGSDRYATAAMVAADLFPSSLTLVGFSSGEVFPDSLSGGPNIAAHGSPLLLLPSNGALPTSVTSYLAAHPSISAGLLYGGTSAVSSDVQAELDGQFTPGTVTLVNISSASITGVSCPTTTWCMAVDAAGNAITYANGAWGAPVVVDTGARSMNTTGEFDGVSCPTTTFCMAVSYLDGYSIYQSGAWGPMTGPPGSIADSYHGVSCVSSTYCAAESDNFGDLTFYDSGTWSQPTAHNGIGIGDSVSSPIACSSPEFCMYVAGDKYQTATAGALSAAKTIDPAATKDVAPNVSCTSPTSCVMVFADGGLAEAWNGTSFTSAGDILAAGDSSIGLNGVSCVSTFCAAPSDQELYVTSNQGGSWSGLGAFTTAGTSAAISCPSSTLCFIGGVHGYMYALNPGGPLSPV
jgi:putative cell wall-binding protein